MPYRFRRHESVADGIRRIVREEVLKAVDAAESDQRATAERVHDVRTSCKKIRGVLRIARPALKDCYQRENVWFRDAARSLSEFRDATVVLDLFDDLARDLTGDRSAVADMRSHIESQVKPADTSDVVNRLQSVSGSFRGRLVEIDDWQIKESGFTSLGRGWEDVYRRGRQAMRQALHSSNADDARDAVDWHEWRKQAKYHWYQVRLFRNVWKPVMQARRSELNRLTDLLGCDHDLTVLAATVSALDEAPADAVASLLPRIDDRRRQLRSAARPLGQRLYAESPKAFRKRMRRYWKIWRADGTPTV